MTAIAIQRRDSRSYRAARTRFLAQCKADDAECHLCGQPIDYTAEQGHPDAFELDHFYPVSERPDLIEDPANFRPSHGACNRRRGNRAAVYALGNTSRTW